MCLIGLMKSQEDSVAGTAQARERVVGDAARGIMGPFWWPCGPYEGLGPLLCVRWDAIEGEGQIDGKVFRQQGRCLPSL